MPEYWAAQVKLGNVSGKSNSYIDLIVGQAQEAFKIPIHDIQTAVAVFEALEKQTPLESVAHKAKIKGGYIAGIGSGGWICQFSNSTRRATSGVVTPTAG